MDNRTTRAGRLFPILLLFAAAIAGGCAGPPSEPQEQRPADADLVAAAERMEQRGDLNGALQNYVKVLDRKGGDADLFQHVGRIEDQLGNVPAAVDAYDRALRIDPGRIEAHEALGLLLLRLGHAAEAQPHLQQAVTGNPRSWRSWNALGVIFDLKGEHGVAQQSFARALTERPDDPELLNNRGFSQYLSGNYPAARADFERALALNPGYAKAWSNLGLLLARSGSYDQAVEAFQHVTDPASARYDAAYVCLLDGKAAAAETLLRASIKAAPSYNAAATAALEHLRAQRQGMDGLVMSMQIAPNDQ